MMQEQKSYSEPKEQLKKEELHNDWKKNIEQVAY